MKLSLINENSSETVVLYRQDPRFIDGDQQKLVDIIKSGKYDGRYFAYTKEAVYEYYSRECLILTVILPISDLGVDGAYWDGPLLGEKSAYSDINGSPDISDIKQAGKDLPQKYKERYMQLSLDALKNGGPISKYYGSTTKEAFEFYLTLSQMYIHHHLKNHGQVALLGRKLHIEEVIDIDLAPPK